MKKNIGKISKKIKVLVVGDLMLDEYLYGNVERISPEAPVPIVRLEKKIYSLGGAGNVSNNISSLGAKASLISIVGNDETSRIIGSLLGATLFFLTTNFGVWSLGSYGYSIEGLIACYTLALPFFAYSFISTLIFAVIIEFLLLQKIIFKNYLVK